MGEIHLVVSPKTIDMAATTFQTKIQVCNLALNLIGANEIEAFTDNSREARLLNANYELWVHQCFSKFQWRFAVTVDVFHFGVDLEILKKSNIADIFTRACNGQVPIEGLKTW